MCSNASITEILGINDNNLVILGNEKENIKGIEYTVLRGKLSYRPDSCPKCGTLQRNFFSLWITEIQREFQQFLRQYFQKSFFFLKILLTFYSIYDINK